MIVPQRVERGGLTIAGFSTGCHAMSVGNRRDGDRSCWKRRVGLDVVWWRRNHAGPARRSSRGPWWQAGRPPGVDMNNRRFVEVERRRGLYSGRSHGRLYSLGRCHGCLCILGRSHGRLYSLGRSHGRLCSLDRGAYGGRRSGLYSGRHGRLYRRCLGGVQPLGRGKTWWRRPDRWCARSRHHR